MHSMTTAAGQVAIGDTISATDEEGLDVTGQVLGITNAPGDWVIEVAVERDYAPEYATQVYPDAVTAVAATV